MAFSKLGEFAGTLVGSAVNAYNKAKNKGTTKKTTTNNNTSNKSVNASSNEVKPAERKNFIAIGGEARRGTVSTKPVKSGHPYYQKATKKEKEVFNQSYNALRVEKKKPIGKVYKTQSEIPVGARKRHADGSISVKNEDGSITRTKSYNNGTTNKISHTDKNGSTKYYANINGKEQEVKAGYVKTVKDLIAEGKGGQRASAERAAKAKLKELDKKLKTLGAKFQVKLKKTL